MKAIEVLLTETIECLGIVGDVVKVKAGYARNFLLPCGKAIVPTPGNVAKLAERRAEVAAELAVLRKKQEAIFAKLENYELTLERSANDQGILFGGVNQHDIAEALRANGFAIEDRYVRTGEQIKHLDTYYIPIQLAADLKTEIKLWVVSDKPLEEEKEETKEETEENAEEGAVVETEESAQG